MNKSEIVHTKARSVSCLGKEAPYDHPLVYLEIVEEVGKIDCPYCGKEFVLTK
ncbi:MAG: zinc-finger domain-containing protein [Pseudomonadota bacterium]